ncbi:hypothetical protein DLD99_23250 [Pseudomonas kribbensis]|uniref:Uncharacterized protein n=1 Tax=Pseudomonas kribbensis TaxID=1628086 RepID=A0A345RVF7_9PSED|nr:hypothetical protein [Pseudomonas kribbensis]AXI63273.1 hypothetical protein DLD99_23250 [Pseudomonas kribbensis]
MSFFQSKKRGASEPAITVSAETKATVSGRVGFQTQIVEFEADNNSDLIALVSRANSQDYSHRSKKGLVLIFDKNIQSGTYAATDPQFPSLYYFETATIPGFTTSYMYNAVSGSVSVEVVANTAKQLHYNIDFDFKGVDNKNEELKIAGRSTYTVLFNNL